MYQQAALACAIAATAFAQQPGPLTPEVHPKLPSQKCTLFGGCKTVQTSVVLDSQYRWTHSVDGYVNCNAGTWDQTLCPDVKTCAQNCAVEGVDYASYGISTSGNSLTLNLFTTDPSTNATKLASPGVYLLEDDQTYDMFKLLGKEFTYDVDVSGVPCGVNGALYLSEMEATGNKNALNAAGAKYGTGYCDAQCPAQNWFAGEANLDGTWGVCCNEMDIWEANSQAEAYTPHPCKADGPTKCTGTVCGNGDDRYNGLCDKDGCDFQPYRTGDKGYYGPGKKVDTTKKFTVVTQFFTDNLLPSGNLAQIRRLYIQNGKIIANSFVKTPGIKPYYNYISDSYCINQKSVFNNTNDFADQGGMKQIGAAIGRGMVLAMSIWWDTGSYMQWLDGVTGDVSQPGNLRGPCVAANSHPDYIQANFPNAKVTFSNIKSGDIASTFKLF